MNLLNAMFMLEWLTLMIDSSGDAALMVVPQLVQYDNNDDFVSFYCMENDYTEVPVDWLDPDGNVMADTTEASRICVEGSFVTFEPPMKSDAGSYWCRSKTNHSNRAEGVLQYLGPPELLFEQNQTVLVNVSKQVVLNCTVSSSPDPVYNWSIPDTCSSCPHTNNDSVMIFTADITDSGEYVCAAGNEYGSISMHFIFIPADNSTVYEDVVTILGSDVSFNCSVDHLTQQDNYTIVWQSTISNGQVIIHSFDSSVLNIHDASPIDERNYFCYDKEFYVAYKIINLKIVWPPEFPSAEQNQTMLVNVSEQVVLNCTVSSSPDPVYNWSIPDTCSSCPHTNNDSVIIFTADITDSGEYVCTAGNEYGSVQINFVVTVFIHPTFIFSNQSYLFEESMALQRFDTFINCSVDYYRTPYNGASWMFNDMPISSNESSKYGQNISGLIILDTSTKDEGLYTCSVGQLRADILVDVIWPPELLSEQNQTVLVNVSEQVVLNCTVSSSPDPVYNWSIPDTCSSCPHTNNGSVIIFTVDITDSGEYVCTAGNDYGILSVLFRVIVNAYPAFIFSNNSYLHEKRTILRGSSAFINCSVNYGTVYNRSLWQFENEQVLVNMTSKYALNESGLLINNVTAEDQGNYTCSVGLLKADILVVVIWPPTLLSEQNQTVLVNVSEQVVLNCTVSSSPDPVYNWSIPDTCSSCPHINNDSVIIFTVDITDSGEYVCTAGNEYGRVTSYFDFNVVSQPILTANITTIINDQNEIKNAVLTCEVSYAYPVPTITWRFLSETSTDYEKVNNSFSGNYILYRNASLEVYHRFIIDNNHLIFVCTAANKYGSSQRVFHLWNKEMFSKVREFSLYVNAVSCRKLTKETNAVFEDLWRWFNSLCNCDGYNILRIQKLDCINYTTGQVTTKLGSGDDQSAQMLIDLMVADIEGSSPPVISMKPDWVICLTPNCNWTLNSDVGSGMRNEVLLDFYVKNITDCHQVLNRSGQSMIDSIDGLLTRMCNCKPTDFYVFKPTCWDNTTAKIIALIESNGNYTAQMMADLIVDNIQRQHPPVQYLSNGWVACINPDCDWNLSNQMIMMTVTNDDSSTTSLIIGIVLGLLSVAVIILIIVIAVTWRIRRSHCRQPPPKVIVQDSVTKESNHIYDELSMYTMLPFHDGKNPTPSPRSDKVVFDTARVEPPSYQPLPASQHTSCSASSMNDYHDFKSIREEDSQLLKPQCKSCSHTSMNDYHDVKIKEGNTQLPKARYESCSASSIEKYNDYRIEEDARSINEEDCKTAMTTTEQQEPYSKLYHFKEYKI